MFATEKQLEELTGFKHHSKQEKWLAKNHFKYFLDCGGRPRVSIAHIEERMGTINIPKKRIAKEPDAEALRHHLGIA